MKERPILFSGPMVRAILAGAKTQTRRVVNSPAKNMQEAGMEVIKRRAPGDPWYKDHVWSMRGSTGVWGDHTEESFRALCPYGQPGDRLWVRETWAPCPYGLGVPIYRASMPYSLDERHDAGLIAEPKRWHPSIHMPYRFSRIMLEVTSVRVERLQEISEADAKAEGVDVTAPTWTSDHRIGWAAGDHRGAFSDLWKDINGPDSWDANPWVWVVGFRLVWVVSFRRVGP